MATALWASTAVAQTVAPNTSTAGDDQPQARPGIDVRVLAHTDGTLELANLKNKFHLAIAEINAKDKTTSVGEVEVQDLTEDEFKVAERVFSGAINTTKKKRQVGEYLERNSKNTNEWLVKLDSVNDELLSLDLTYGVDKNTAATTTKTFKAASRDAVPDGDLNRLRFLNGGEYVFVVDPTWQLKEYVLEIQSGKMPPFKTEAETWPNDKYYLVQLRNYQGDLYKLWDQLASKNIGNPLKDIRAERGMVALADWVTVRIGRGDWMSDSIYRVDFSRIPGEQNITNVWMLFPLSKEEADRVEGEIRIYATKYDQQAMATAIASEAGFLGFRSAPASADGLPTPLKSDSPPQWYQVPPKRAVSATRTAPDGAIPAAPTTAPAAAAAAPPADSVPFESFEREFKVEDKKNWVQGTRVEKTWQIVCYEFTTPEAKNRLILEVEKKLYLKDDSLDWAEGFKEEEAKAQAEGR